MPAPLEHSDLTYYKRVRLTNEEWRTIAAWSGLPRTAQPDLERLISHFAACHRAFLRRKAESIRDDLDRTRKAALKLRQRLEKILDKFADESYIIDSGLAFPLMLAWPGAPIGETPRRLLRLARQLSSIEDWFSRARQVTRSKSGAASTASSQRIMVNELDQILEQYAATKVGRSRKLRQRYVEAVSAIVEREAGIPPGASGSVEQAIKYWAENRSYYRQSRQLVRQLLQETLQKRRN